MTALSLGCSSTSVSQPAVCDPGDSKECTCPGGSKSAQVCSDDGARFEDCACGAVGATGGATSSGGATGSAGGPSVGGSGGDQSALCEQYCFDMSATCPDEYASIAACATACAGFTVGASTDTSGDTLSCRINHLTFAGGDPGTHCAHAGESGAGVCQ